MENERTSMRTEQATERVSGGLKDLARDPDDILSATTGQMGEPRSRLAAAVAAANATCQRLEEQTVAALTATDRCIRGHPYETITIAFGLGLAIGVLLSRK